MIATCGFSRADDYILGDAVITASVAPSTTYDLATLGSLLPAARVRWGVGTVTITFTLGSARRADAFALPVHNLDAGSGVLTLTNGAGLSQVVPVPVMPPSRIPRTIVLDLTIGTPSAGTRTSDVWHLVISGNSVNVTLGGAVWLGGPWRVPGRNYLWNPQRGRDHHQTRTPNEYGTEYVVDYATMTRSLTVAFDIATDVDRQLLEDIDDASHGGALLTLFWPDPAVNDALLGRLPVKFTDTPQWLNLTKVPVTFTEVSKGKPV